MEYFFGRGKDSTDFSSERVLYINNCGYVRRLEKDVSVLRPKGRADYHLLLNAAGEIRVNGERVGEGEAYILFPWEAQDYTYVSKGSALYYWLHFSGTRVPELLDNFGLARGKYSLADSKGEAEEIFRRMIGAVSGEWEGTDNYMSGQFYSLLALLSTPRRSSNPFSKAVRALCDVSDKTGVSELAASYNMSDGHFIRQFKSYTGYTPLEYRMMKRMEGARSLLAGTDLSITDISRSLGFDDPLYFSRIFRKHVGMSPRDYRKKYI